MSEKDIEELQKHSDYVYQNLLTGISDDVETEKGALDIYTTGGFVDINGSLHNPSEKERMEPYSFPSHDWAQVDSAIRCLDSAISKFSLDLNITVFRGDKLAHFNGWDVGDIKTYPAFMSTSALENKAEEFAESLKLEIFVPKETPGMYIGTNSVIHKDEAEFLLGRGLNFRVLGHTEDTLKLEVLL